MGFFETNGALLDKWEIKTNTADGGKAILSDIAQAVDNKLAQESISKSDVQGLGIGVPGPVRSDGVVNGCVNLGWGVTNVAEELGKLTGLEIKVGNDANVAALGEMWQGGAKGSRDVVMVTLGTGVGGGIIVDGKIVAGFNGAGG
jgi:glucokinase